MAVQQKYDFIIIGGGIFGVYAAIYLAGHRQRVCLIEKEAGMMLKASTVNQARLHGGYHYPRSVSTAQMSDENKARFTEDHKPFIHFGFEQYYAIDEFNSFTDGVQFERFCNFIGIPCKPVSQHPLINFGRIESLYVTQEYSFDPVLINQYYRSKLKACSNVRICLNTRPVAAQAAGGGWEVEILNTAEGTRERISAGQVINATYAGSNAINDLFGVRNIELMHEISEIALVSSPQLGDRIGLTIMDGPFASMMPYGKSGLLSLSSVAYTHHKVSYEASPAFVCQQINLDCQPEYLANCNYCVAKPASNQKKMVAQIRQYLEDEVELNYFGSLFTIKSKLMANYIDDGRPTEIAVLNDNPRFYCIFAGKINSIYEIEKVVDLG